MTIRPYRHDDYEVIRSWWTASGAIPPEPGMMIEDGTFVLEALGRAVMSLTVLLTQSCLAYFEGYIADPKFTRGKRAGELLWSHCYDFARSRGAKQVILYAAKEKLVKRYQELGAVPALHGVTAMTRSLACLG